MRKISTNITLDPKLKKEAVMMLKEMGLDLSTFVSLSLKALLNEGEIPFKVRVKYTKYHASKVMKEVMDEYEDMLKHPEKYKKYTAQEIIEELHSYCK